MASHHETSFYLDFDTELKDSYEFQPKKMSTENETDFKQMTRSLHGFDLNLPPSYSKGLLPMSQHIENGSGVTVKKKKRASSKLVAKIGIEDLAKYFGHPIKEASENLEISLTVLKKKCREFGIPRWPHRKIKSLDSLIRDLQEEGERQREENEAAAMAVAKRQRTLETEKGDIERKPFMELQTETKRFRQDVYKRRCRARAFKKHDQDADEHPSIKAIGDEDQRRK